MKNYASLFLKLFLVFIVLISCEKKTKQELLIGKWQINSWITTHDKKENEAKEMMTGTEFVTFDRDSLHLTIDNTQNTYRYFLMGDSLIVPADKLGTLYMIQFLDDEKLFLFQENDFSYANEKKKLHVECKIKMEKVVDI